MIEQTNVSESNVDKNAFIYIKKTLFFLIEQFIEPWTFVELLDKIWKSLHTCFLLSSTSGFYCCLYSLILYSKAKQDLHIISLLLVLIVLLWVALDKSVC